jgi:ribosome-associated protein
MDKCLFKILDFTTVDLLKYIIRILKNNKGNDILVVDLFNRSGFFDYIVFVSFNSKQTNYHISNKIYRDLKNMGISNVVVEGNRNCNWILLSCNNIVIHFFYFKHRSDYKIEDIWTDSVSLPHFRPDS